MNNTPSGFVNRLRCSAVMSSLRSPFRNGTTGIASRFPKASISATKPLLMGSINALDAKGYPRWYRKKLATPPSRCNCGT